MELQPRRRRSEALARWADPGWWGGSAGWGWGPRQACGRCRNRPELCRALYFLPPSLGEPLAGSGTLRQAPFHSQPPRGTPSDRLLKGGL